MNAFKDRPVCVGQLRCGGLWLGLFFGLALTGLVGGWVHRHPLPVIRGARPAAAQEQEPRGFLALPILNGLGDDPLVCHSLVGLQNLGDEAAQAVLLLWEGHLPGLPCAGPLQVQCSGLLAPGATWALQLSLIHISEPTRPY